MDVHLADDVADAGDVEFVGLKVGGGEVGNLADEEGHFGEVIGGELVEVFDAFFDFGDDKEPRERGIVFEEDLATGATSDEVCSGFEAGVECEGHCSDWSYALKSARALAAEEHEAGEEGEKGSGGFRDSWDGGGGRAIDLFEVEAFVVLRGF